MNEPRPTKSYLTSLLDAALERGTTLEPTLEPPKAPFFAPSLPAAELAESEAVAVAPERTARPVESPPSVRGPEARRGDGSEASAPVVPAPRLETSVAESDRAKMRVERDAPASPVPRPTGGVPQGHELSGATRARERDEASPKLLETIRTPEPAPFDPFDEDGLLRRVESRIARARSAAPQPLRAEPARVREVREVREEIRTERALPAVHEPPRRASEPEAPPPTTRSEPPPALRPAPAVEPLLRPVANRPWPVPVVEASTPSPATIQVTIGRIEVRASSAPQRPPRSSSPNGPKMSLEAYLREREGGNGARS